MVIRTIKCVDIGLLGLYFLVIGVSFAQVMRIIFDKSTSAPSEKSTARLLGRIIFRTVLIMLFTYATRLIIKKIPFFLNGYFGYDHFRLQELHGGVIVAFSMIALQGNYLMEIKEFLKRIHLED